MQHNFIALHVLGAGLDDLSQSRVEGISESNMPDNTALEEGKGTDTFGPVNDLIGNNKVHGLDVLLQRADGRKSDDASHTNMSKGSNVGTIRHFVGSKLMM